MPGTMGSAVAALAALAVLYGLGEFPWWGWLTAAALLFVLSLPVAARSQELHGAADPGWFVLDEVVGVWLCLCGLQELFALEPWKIVCVAFLWFRVFDMLKPWPIRQIERRMKGAVGIMVDDVLAALMSWPLIAATLWYLSPSG